MTGITLSAAEKKKLNIDLWIIGIVSCLALGIVVFAMQNGMNDFVSDCRVPIVLRALVIGVCGQFAVAGLGISQVF